MKISLTKWACILSIASLLSCDSEVQCPAFGSADFAEYTGRLENYGDQLLLISNGSDSLTYNLKVGYTEPYTCTSSYQKDCECNVGKEIRHTNNTSDCCFYMHVSSISFGKGPEVADLWIEINGLITRFYLYKDSEPEIGITRGYQYFSTDTVIHQRPYDKVVVGHYDEDNPESYIVLAREEGLVAHKDLEGTVWYREF